MADEQQQLQEENPYRDLIRQDRAQQGGQLRAALATGAAPDAKAQAAKLAAKYRMPLELVERNLDSFKQREREDLPEERRLLKANPKLADWLRTSEVAAAAADDVPQLQELDNRLTFGASILRGIDNVQAMGGAFLEASGEITGSTRLTRYGREIRKHNEEQAGRLGYKSTLGDAIRGPWELAQYVKELVGEQIPVMAPIMAGGTTGAAVGSVVPVIGTGLGALIGAAIPAFVLGVGETEQNVKQNDPNASAPELVFLGGTAVAALDTAVPGKIGSRLVRTFGRETAEAVAKRALLAPVAPRFLRGVAGQGVSDMASEALTEALQEAIGQVTANVGTGHDTDWRQVGRQMLEAGVGGGIVGAGFSGSAAAIAHPRERARFAAGQQSEAFFQALGQSAASSKLLERLPAGAREFVARATKDGPIETVYAPADTFSEYWQSQGVDPAVMAAELTGKADALEHARATGADLAIPLADYATKLAATDHNAFFSRELRLAPQLLNAREAEALQAEFEQLQESEGKIGKSEGNSPADPHAQEVGRRIHEQALAAGESDQVAGVWSKLYETVYGQIAQRYKRNALELFEQRPLSIQRDDGLVFTPAAPGERIGVDIPASEATPGESSEQRITRRLAHLEALTAAYTRDARRQDPNVDPAQLRHELELRLDQASLVREAQEESGHGQDLLRAIAGYGGISEDAVEGEFRELAAEGYDRRRRGPVMTKHGERMQTFGRREWNGVAGVFAKGGRALTPDGMLEALRQDNRFHHIESINDLHEAIEVARRGRQDAPDTFPGTEELQELGIVPGQKWWADSWQEPDVDETEPADGDTSFNPDELEQQELLQPRPLEESVGQVRDLERQATDEALGVIIPGETINPDTGEPYDRASGESYFRINGQPRYDMSAVNCTHCAEAFLESSGATGVIVGYDQLANDGKISPYSGHDFAIVEGRFLVDPWAHHVEGSNPRAVFDLEDPQDLAFVRQQYASPARWVERTQVGAHEWSWLPYRSEQLGTSSEELLQVEPDRRRSHRDALGEAITRVRQQDPAAGSVFFEEGMDPESRTVPFQVAKDYRTVFRAFSSAGAFQWNPTDATVPVDQVFATQHTFRPDVAEQYLRHQDAGGQDPRPLAIKVEDRYYINDGHHRAIAQWATGRKDLDLRVVDSGLTLESLGEAGDAFTLTDEATAAGAESAGHLRGTRADKPTSPAGRQLEDARKAALDAWLQENQRTRGEEYFQLAEEDTPDGFEVIAEHLTAPEVARVRRETAQRLIDVFETLPQDSDYEDAATAAVAKKGWYERSTKAIRAVFGPVDAVRFSALLAALSPQVGIEANFLNAVQLWVRWIEADRPTSPASIKKLLARSVRGGGKRSVFEAWQGNVVRALSNPDPLTIQLSGPKVSSFMANLHGNLQEVTQDTWMANFALVEKEILKGKPLRVVGVDEKLAGKPMGYLAMNAKIRRVAKSLTRKTGVLWTPAHVQETVWSWAKTIYELAEAERSSAVRVLKEGGVTDAAIGQTPDFGELFVKDATVREILEAAGYGEVLDTLERAVGRAARQRDAASAAGGDAASQGGVTPALLRAAKRIDTIRRQRAAAALDTRNAGLIKARRRIAQARRSFRGRGGAEFYQGEQGGDIINTPRAAVERVPELAGGEFGALLLDTHHQPLAFLPINEEATHILRQPGGLRELLKGIGAVNAASAIVYAPGAGDAAQLSSAKNVANALQRQAVSVFDLVVTNPQGLPMSVREQRGGDSALSGEFWQADYTALEGLHSRIVAAVQASTLAKASGAQWKATIRNAGVNADEYSAIAVDQLEDGRSYTREELLDYIGKHQVQLQVLTLSDEGPTDAEVSARADRIFDQMADREIERQLLRGVGPDEVGLPTFTKVDGEYFSALEREDGQVDEVGGPFATEREAQAAAEAEANKLSERAWGAWRLDVLNSLNYSEAESEARTQLHQERATRNVQYADYTTDGADPGSYREVFLLAPETSAGFDPALVRIERTPLVHHAGTVKLFYANEQIGHFDEKYVWSEKAASWIPGTTDTYWMSTAAALTKNKGNWTDGHSDYGFVQNPIVRIRFNARTAAGVKTLFLEEVQPPTREEQKRMPRLFQKNWRELAFKWALQHAVANGFDQLAWTQGEVQVDRYALARQVQSIDWTWRYQQQDGVARQLRDVFIVQKDTGTGIPQPLSFVVDMQGTVVRALSSNARNLEDKHLADVVGPEIAKRILEGPGKGELKGLDLKVGGEGLRKLYDVDFPAVVSRLTKRAGVKAGPTQVPLDRIFVPLAARDTPALERLGVVWGLPQSMQNAAVQAWYEKNQRGVDVAGSQLEAHGVAITPALREQVLGGMALFQDPSGGKPKGGYNPSTNVVRLVAGKADLSTFLHESGHFFLEVLGDIAAGVKVDTEDPQEQQLLRDMATVLKHGGFQGSLAEWRSLPVDARRGVHESFARSFEQYLSDGKAPSPELRELFVRFRDWLVAVYRNARGLGLDINPELRSVFDRLLASDEAIADAQHEAQVIPLLTDPASAGVDPLTFEAYRREVAEASQASREELDRLLLRDWRREREAWWKAERELVRAGIQQEVHAQPVYQAISVLRSGRRPDGTVAYDKAPKLSKRAIVNQYGREVLDTLKGKQVYSAEGGIHPDTAAELFGFATGEALMEAIAAAPPMNQVIDAEADRRMREKHGDLLLDGMELREAAEASLFHHRSRVISAELEALTKGMAGASIPPAAVIKAQADALIRRLPVRELRPGQYLNAARRASQAAFWHFGRNDRRLAIQAKQQELLALAHWRAARDAKERADAIRDRLKRYADKQSTRARIGRAGADYLEQIDGFLERYEFARVPKRDLEKRQSLRAFVARLEADGLPVEIPEEVLEDARSVNWQELPLEQLEGIAAAVDQIAHLASLKNKLLKARDQRELAEVRAEIADSIRRNVKQRTQSHEPRSYEEKRKAFFEGMFASHRKIASLARELDGFVDGGPMWERVIRPLNEAGNAEASQNADATRRLMALFHQHYATPASRAELYRKQWIEALGPRDDVRAQLSKQARLMVALNWGNETNRQRVLAGKNWTPQQVEAILATLDRRDWQFVQDVWRFVDSYWPAIADKQRRVTGLAPPKVEATPVFTRFGEFEGGYFPLMYEGQLSGRVFNLEEAAAADMQKAAAYVHATTERGHTKERTEGNVRLPVRLDFGVLFEHTARVIHDLTHHEVLVDVGRIVGSEDVQSAIYETLGPKAYDQFRRALKDIAVGDVPAQHELESAISHLRTGATIVGLGWSFSTMLLQPLGLTQSMKRIGTKHVVRGLAKWLRGAAHREKVVAGIHEKSEFMANRARTQMREVNEIRNRIGVDTGKWTAAAESFLSHVPLADKVTKQGMLDSYFYGIAKFQQMADVPTWLGAYEKAKGNDVDEDTAVALADQAVLDSQGGGQIKDLAAVQRGSPSWKVWTNFYSFFSTTYNLWTESYRHAKREATPAAIGRLAVDYLLLCAVPAVLGHLVRAAAAGDLDDELEDPEQLAVTLAGELAAYMTGTMVGLRELGGWLQGYANYDGPAGARGFASIGRLVAQAQQLEADEAFWKSLNATGGVLFHYPAGQVERTFRGIKAIVDGESTNPLAPLAGPGKQK